MTSRSLPLLLLLLLPCLLCISSLIGSSAAYGSDRVRLEDVKALTLRSGAYTNGRRSSPVPQMSCVGGTAHCPQSALPKIMQCTNQGSNGYDVQWKCEAQLPKEYKLVETTVSCEGYDYPDDPFILAGSCGVEYTMDLTGYREPNSQQYSQQYQYTRPHYTYEASSHSWFGSLVSMAFFFGISWVIYKICTTHRTAPMYANTAAGTGTGTGWAGTGFTTHAPNTAGGPGFWTGLGLGGLAGAWGARRNNHHNGWGWGWGNRHNTYGGAPYQGGNYTAPPPAYSSPSGGSSSTTTSTGYGGTKRR